ncbi:hypothetical protein FGIG_04509 [Fasciola gigantica]|uniref:Uncharacterized protein n=1 Tax=Fasciola gigantica TaxID=46835 RepID=A0A504Z359_FASGI|nr:hypothetical protein FGIG_04509 [Fasciola gigantica]
MSSWWYHRRFQMFTEITPRGNLLFHRRPWKLLGRMVWSDRINQCQSGDFGFHKPT